MSAHLFGIRHHGPGSARSLRAALEALQPDVVLVEGPPDAAAVLPLLAHPEMKPPVALLLYAPDTPQRAVYYPFARFSPEWQAIRYALSRPIPVRFMDLPQACQLARRERAATPDEALPPEGDPGAPEAEAPDPERAAGAEMAAAEEPKAEAPEAEADALAAIRRDPLRWIAEAAGYSDGETWWEQMVEQRRDSADLFQGILEAMAALRAEVPPEEEPDPVEAQREAFMRQTIRAAEKEGFRRIAVVCGAWHAPALADGPSAKEDAETLKNLPKVTVAATWIPWTYGRLTFWSGYGAGIASPAWYQHLWDAPENVVAAWMTRAARLLRAEDLPASPASVIEAVRLAEALAAVRERPLPGLPELLEAARAVFCFGSDLPMRLIQEKLVVGEQLGQVPAETPSLPIQQDLRREQKRLRIEPEAAHRDLDLDQRRPNDLERSRLLHRLNLLGVPWGRLQQSGGGKGTFHELWRLQWQPEFEVSLIEANVWGNTVLDATIACVRERAARADALPALTSLVEQTLLADLPDAVRHLMTRLESLAAVTSDIPHLMEALPPLANVLRYGSVRQTDTRLVGHVVDGLMARLCIGLPGACAALNDEAAAQMFALLMAVHQAVGLLQREEHRAAWNAALAQMADQQGLHGLLAGRCCRLLLDQEAWSAEEVGRRMGLAVSPANEPALAAAWVEGLLQGSGALLLHNDDLWQILDTWVAGLSGEQFVQQLPLLRRTFATFPPPERRQMGERARAEGMPSYRRVGATTDLDTERAERVLPLAAQLLGLTYAK
jgi:hypothetical protein